MSWWHEDGKANPWKHSRLKRATKQPLPDRNSARRPLRGSVKWTVFAFPGKELSNSLRPSQDPRYRKLLEDALADLDERIRILSG